MSRDLKLYEERMAWWAERLAAMREQITERQAAE